jgi:tetratricopeptide (TPR) repeat protein
MHGAGRKGIEDEDVQITSALLASLGLFLRFHRKTMADQNIPNAAPNTFTATGAEKFINDNRQRFVYVIGAVIAVIVLSIGYDEFVVQPANADANEDMWRAEQYFMVDSTDWALNGDGLSATLQDVMDEHSGTSAAARAAYEMGLILRGEGDFAGALDAFNESDMDGEILSVIVEINRGDCMVELGDYDAALRTFNAAAKSATGSNAGGYLAPLALYKSAVVAMELGNNSSASASLNSIVKDYPNSPQRGAAEGLAAALGNG